MSGTGLSINGKTVGVVGAGMTGRAVAEAVASLGGRVVVADSRSPEQAPPEAEAALATVASEVHWGDARPLASTDLVVLSPGIGLADPFLDHVHAAPVEIIGEVELAYRLRPDATLVGITGTNGKSTTTALTGAMLDHSGLPARVCGNIGSPLITHVLDAEGDPVFVVELSSFQLESCTRARMRSAALLNVSDDHGDRHPTLAEYLAAKARIFGNQTQEDTAVLGADCPVASGLASSIARARLLWFSAVDRVAPGAYLRQGGLWIESPGADPALVLPIDEMALAGIHNIRNACAAICLAHSRGATIDGMAEALRATRSGRHTFETVGVAGGVTWINDSKGTNVDSTLMALESCQGPVVLIAGGSEKGADYSTLGPAMAAKCRAVVTLGDTGPAIEAEARRAGLSAIHRCSGMVEAVSRAAGLAQEGDRVLLSPASASFGLFRNYAHRGEAFEEAVRGLEGFVPSGATRGEASG
jgi:UDP-N-acetylmuramoylalanine--D-glutamate ligase